MIGIGKLIPLIMAIWIFILGIKILRKGMWQEKNKRKHIIIHFGVSLLMFGRFIWVLFIEM